MRREDRLTKEDMQDRPSTDKENTSVECSAGPILFCSRAAGLFDQHDRGSLDNVAPADIYFGRAKEVQSRREKIKRRMPEARR